MQSLAEFADLSYGSAMNMQIKMDDGTDQNVFKITSKNNLVLQQVEVSLIPFLSFRNCSFWMKSDWKKSACILNSEVGSIM